MGFCSSSDCRLGRGGWDSASENTALTVLVEMPSFFLNKLSLHCCKAIIRVFKNLEFLNVYFDSCCSGLASLMEEWIFRAPYSNILDVLPSSRPHFLRMLLLHVQLVALFHGDPQLITDEGFRSIVQ